MPDAGQHVGKNSLLGLFGISIAGTLTTAFLILVAITSCMDEKVTAGEAYGFRVGCTKQEALDVYLDGRRQGMLASLEPVPSEEEARAKFPWIVGSLKPSEAEAVFSRWTTWSVLLRGEVLCILRFEAGALKTLRQPDRDPEDQMTLDGGGLLRCGQTYQGVLAVLVDLEKAVGKAVSLRTGWMAARPPEGSHAEQMLLMSAWDHWRIDVEGLPQANVIWLEFDEEGLLSAIRRHMHPMPK